MNSDSPQGKVLLPNTERLACLLQEQLTQWENDFCRSLLAQCTKAGFSSFSVKQENKLRSIEYDYGLSRFDTGQPRIYQVPSSNPAAIKDIDDIPF